MVAGAVLAAWLLPVCAAAVNAAPPLVIGHSANATDLEKLAARELRRYVYQVTGRLCTVEPDPDVRQSDVLVVGRAGSPGVVKMLRGFSPPDVGPDSWALRTDDVGDLRVGVVTGGSALATLHAAYEYAERVLGVVHTLHEDVIPSGRRASAWRPPRTPPVTGMPSFSVRGLQPFHDFSFGPDWWGADEWKAVIGQMAKLKMNFVGLHAYPYNNANQPAEPAVWLGPAAAVNDEGDVVNASAAYPSTWRNTLGGGWGMVPKNTSSYAAGAAMLFDSDCYGSSVLKGTCQEGCGQDLRKCVDRDLDTLAVNSAKDLLADVFGFAKRLGMSTAVGTEVPLTKPPGYTGDSQALFEGAFKRLQHVGIDYYWHWTSEAWRHGQLANSTETAQAVADIRASAAALSAVGAPFKLATSGWTWGPTDDLTYFDRVLGSNVSALSALDRDMGWVAQYTNVTQHASWAIPWMEDDATAIGVELWANRTIQHAREAHAYGVTGLLGCHWRTIETASSVRALAAVGWNVSASVDDVYREWAAASFGPEVAERAADIFLTLDSYGAHPTQPGAAWFQCRNLGYCSDVPRYGLTCCGRWTTWSVDLSSEFGFVDEFLSLRGSVKDSNDLMRFDQWAGQFQHLRLVTEAELLAYRFGETMKFVENHTDPTQRAELAKTVGVQALFNVSRGYEKVLTALESYAASQAELGMLAVHEGVNWPMEIVPLVDRLQTALGAPPPKSALPTQAYAGEPRFVLLGPLRTLVGPSEGAFTVRAACLAPKGSLPDSAVLTWSPLGAAAASAVAMGRVAEGRGRYEAAFAVPATDFEYNVSITLVDGTKLVYPPAGSLSVIVQEM